MAQINHKIKYWTKNQNKNLYHTQSPKQSVTEKKDTGLINRPSPLFNAKTRMLI